MAQIPAFIYVRMSTDLQLKGDSLRRQTERAQKYAAENNLALHTKTFQDLGVSAFKSKNVTDGALGTFLHDVNSGLVPVGSYLLVESLDRLSRTGVHKAFALLNQIVGAGISVVTLIDGKKYSGQFDFPDMLVSLSIMMRAHDESVHKSERHKESVHKSERHKANWEKKRRDKADEKMTANCPHWLALSADKKEFIVDKERETIIKGIFDDTINGFGTELIAKRLNANKVPAWGRTVGWRSSYIKKLLSGENVRGHIRMTEWESGVQSLQVVENYYPRIVDDEVYFRAQQASMSRRHKGGRRGKQIANLFSGLVKCGYCQSVMHIKDAGGKNMKYLVCDKGRRKIGDGCITTGYHYHGLEETFLKLISEVNLSELFDQQKQKSLLNDLQLSIDSLTGQRTDLEKKVQNLIDLIESGTTSAAVLIRITENEKLIQIATTELEILQESKRIEESRIAATARDQEEVRGAIAQMNSLRGDDRMVVRAQVQQRIRTLVSSIEIYAIGRERSDEELGYIHEYVKRLNKVGALLPSGDEWIHSSLTRHYVIGFKSNRQFLVIPTKDDPTAVEMYIDTANLDLDEISFDE